MNNLACCYLLENNITKDQYIGVTINFERRKEAHKYGSNLILKKDIEEYGWKNFSIKKLLTATENYCYDLESKLIKIYNCSKYNIAPGKFDRGDLSGENNGRAKVTEEDVITIRNLYNKKEAGLIELSKKYNLSKTQISKIVYGEHWPHIGGPISKKSKRSKITPEEVFQILDLYNSKNINFTQKKIGEFYNISQQQVSKIIRGEKWKSLRGVDYDK